MGYYPFLTRKFIMSKDYPLNVEIRTRPAPSLGKQSGLNPLGGNGHSAQPIGKLLWKLGKVAVTGGLDEVIAYTTKNMTSTVWTWIDEKYGISDTAATWSEKVVSGLKARLNLQTTLLPSASTLETSSFAPAKVG